MCNYIYWDFLELLGFAKSTYLNLGILFFQNLGILDFFQNPGFWFFQNLGILDFFKIRDFGFIKIRGFWKCRNPRIVD